MWPPGMCAARSSRSRSSGRSGWRRGRRCGPRRASRAAQVGSRRANRSARRTPGLRGNRCWRNRRCRGSGRRHSTHGTPRPRSSVAYRDRCTARRRSMPDRRRRSRAAHWPGRRSDRRHSSPRRSRGRLRLDRTHRRSGGRNRLARSRSDPSGVAACAGDGASPGSDPRPDSCPGCGGGCRRGPSRRHRCCHPLPPRRWPCRVRSLLRTTLQRGPPLPLLPARGPHAPRRRADGGLYAAAAVWPGRHPAHVRR